jgi:hypothetical protein
MEPLLTLLIVAAPTSCGQKEVKLEDINNQIGVVAAIDLLGDKPLDGSTNSTHVICAHRM